MEEIKNSLLEKARELADQEISEATKVEDINKLCNNIANIDNKLQDEVVNEDESKNFELRKFEIEQKINLEKEKINLEKEKLELERFKLETLEEKKIDENKKNRRTFIIGIAGATITTIGGIIVKLLSIKHSNKIYNTELYMTYKDHMIPTPTMKDIQRNALNDSIK